ncbi:MAG: carboxymuconolactone decarboxylase family protein [Lachnospiraceae bacterium]|nr:carboxymuconolactone decarboxylase family protein [Lachnospiraceae bacterium]
MAEKQTAGRKVFGEFAPQFAALNDDVLFGEVRSREEQLSARDRSLITVAALFSAGQYEQLKFHMGEAKKNGVTKDEMVEIITQLAFYCGWPKAWSTFPIAMDIYKDEQ